VLGDEDDMHIGNIHRWQHSHTFGQELKRSGELRTLIVIGITGVMMIGEIVTGILFGSMALLADGLHMASHTAALGINAFAYAYVRRHARNPEYSFGTGKANALGGFSGALLLAVFALLMAWGSVARLIHPVRISYDQAIFVAVLGFVVNAVCVYILQAGDHDHHSHEDHEHSHKHHDDHNLKSAYLHVMADALTSVLAIAALLIAKYLGAIWIDPVMGIVGAVLVARWSLGLLRATSGILLDRQGPESIRHRIRQSIEQDKDSQVADLHLWSIGPSVYAVVVAVVAHEPSTPDEYKARIPKDLGLEHVSIEVHRCGSGPS
jgi:cation diffusion facilitator family transporter